MKKVVSLVLAVIMLMSLCSFASAEQTEFNVMIGLCVGHDTIFLQHSAAPVTVLIVKDRVLGHNPVQALYLANTGYSRFKEELSKQ